MQARCCRLQFGRRPDHRNRCTVISGKHAGLTSTEEVTLFDGTGVVCQDLAVASDAVELALKTGDAVEIVS